MRCSYHPGAQVVRGEKPIPKFAILSVGRKTRIELRCSVPLCPWIAEEPDPDKVDVRTCTSCGQRLGEESYGYGKSKCNRCQAVGRAKRNGLQTRYMNQLAKRSAA